MPERKPTGWCKALVHNPFGALDATGLRPGPPDAATPSATPKTKAEARNRGRVDITREKGGRGGKTVTIAAGFVGIGLPEKEKLVKQMRAACGCGGTVKDGRIEIQGDQREAVARILEGAGFRPVFAGG
jgi:translation initiation factor 1